MSCQCGYSAGCQANHRYAGGYYLYYYCRSMINDFAHDYCGTPRFRADYIDCLVWDWLKTWLEDPESLSEKLEVYEAERDKVNAPLLAQLKVNDDLIKENQVQLDRLLDLYLSGTYNKDALTERKARLEETITKLQRERAKMAERLGLELSQSQVIEIIAFARKLSDGLAEADRSFEARQHIIELLDVRGILAVEGDEKVVYASFVLTPPGERGVRLSLSSVPKGTSCRWKI